MLCLLLITELQIFSEFESTGPVLDFVTKLYRNDSDQDMGFDSKFRIKGNIIMFDVKVLVYLT